MVNLPGSIPLFTRLGTEILNSQHLDYPPHQAAHATKILRKKFLARLRRDPTGQYNCHGLTFAARRTCINVDATALVRKILDDDGYREVPAAEAVAGDIVVYLSRTEIEHTGVIVEVREDATLAGGRAISVLSKWGLAGEYLHVVTQGPYAEDCRITYWTERP